MEARQRVDFQAHLYDRYVVWLVVAIDIATDGVMSQLEIPHLYVFEIQKVVRSKNHGDGAEWEFGYLQFEEGDWERLVENNGDFASVGFEMNFNSPVVGFASFWNDTRPTRNAAPSESLSFRAAFGL